MEEPLVFVDNPTPRWVRHHRCVWTAPRPLTRVIKLFSSYKDCKILFCDYLRINPANIRDAVEEFRHLPREGSSNPSLRCAELLEVLNNFLDGGASLHEHDIASIQGTAAFPVLIANQASRAGAAPEILFRAFRDNQP